MEEVNEAMEDDRRIEEFDPRRRTYALIGSGGTGRILFVGWVEGTGGRYPVHARIASKRLQRRYSR